MSNVYYSHSRSSLTSLLACSASTATECRPRVLEKMRAYYAARALNPALTTGWLRAQAIFRPSYSDRTTIFPVIVFAVCGQNKEETKLGYNRTSVQCKSSKTGPSIMVWPLSESGSCVQRTKETCPCRLYCTPRTRLTIAEHSKHGASARIATQPASVRDCSAGRGDTVCDRPPQSSAALGRTHFTTARGFTAPALLRFAEPDAPGAGRRSSR